MIDKIGLTNSNSMPEDRFWELVELAKWPCDYDKMKIKYIKTMSQNECRSFRLTLDKAYGLIDEIADKMEMGLGDDGYGDFIYHIIGLGKEKFYEYCNNKGLMRKLADAHGYKESYVYCIPYDDDYSSDGKYSIKAVVRVVKEGKKEIERMMKMDTGSNHLMPILTELSYLNDVMSSFLTGFCYEDTSEEFDLRYLVKAKKRVSEACAKIDKFFEKNYMKLPRKFTSERPDGNNFNGMCTAIFTNACSDAEEVLEFLKE